MFGSVYNLYKWYFIEDEDRVYAYSGSGVKNYNYWFGNNNKRLFLFIR